MAILFASDLAKHAVLQVSDAGRLDGLGDLELGIGRRVFEQTSAAAEQNRYDIELQLVEQACRQVLLGDVGAPAEPHVLATGRLLGLLKRRLDAVAREEEGGAALLGQRLAGVMGEHEHGCVEGRVLAPPALPGALTPRASSSAEHASAHDRGADVLKRLLDDGCARVDLAALASVWDAPGRKLEGPLVQLHAPFAQRVLLARVGAGDKAVQGHRNLES